MERQYLDVVDAGGDNLRVYDKAVGAYMKSFQWDNSRYKFSGVSMLDIVSQIQSMVSGVDDELKKLATIFSEKNQNLAACQRKKTVNYTTSDFEDFLTPQAVASAGLVESEYFVTLMCVVPAALEGGNLFYFFLLP